MTSAVFSRILSNVFNKKHLAIFGVLVFFAVIFWVSANLQDAFFESVSAVEDYVRRHEVAGAFVFVLLAAASAFVSPFSSIPIVPGAILIWGGPLTFVMLFSGWMIGDVVTYSVGRFAGYPVLKDFSTVKKIEYYKEKISARASFWLVLGFRFALPSEIGGYVLGLLRYHFFKYFIATSIAEVPFALASVYAIEALVDFEPLSFFFWVSIIIIIMGLTIYLVRRRFGKINPA